MITDEEKIEILNKAYVPEHSVGLIAQLSGGEPFLFQDYFCCRTEDRLILIGYPLQHDFSVEEFDQALLEIKEIFHPAHISLIAPELSFTFAKSCSRTGERLLLHTRFGWQSYPGQTTKSLHQGYGKIGRRTGHEIG